MRFLYGEHFDASLVFWLHPVGGLPDPPGLLGALSLLTTFPSVSWLFSQWTLASIFTLHVSTLHHSVKKKKPFSRFWPRKENTFRMSGTTSLLWPNHKRSCKFRLQPALSCRFHVFIWSGQSQAGQAGHLMYLHYGFVEIKTVILKVLSRFNKTRLCNMKYGFCTKKTDEKKYCLT